MFTLCYISYKNCSRKGAFLSEVVIKQVPFTTSPPQKKIQIKKHKNALITIQSLNRSTCAHCAFTKRTLHSTFV